MKNIKIIKAPTGLGKTKIYIDLAKPGDIIVSPTHDLDKQIASDLKNLGKDYIIATQRPNLVDDENQEYYNLMLKIGNVTAASAYYLLKTKEYENLKTKTKYHLACINWIKQQEELKTTNKIIIATHAKLSTIKNENTKTVWVDEDIFDTCLIKQAQIKVSDFAKLLDDLKNDLGATETKNHDKLNKIVSEIKKGIKEKRNVIRLRFDFTEEEKTEIEKIIRIRIRQYKSSIASLFQKKYADDENEITFVPDYKANTLTLTKIDKSIFNKNINYIIMSATISEKIWRQIFPEMIFKEIKLEDNEQMLLYFKESCSRSKLEKNKEYISYIKNVISTDMPIITFKKFKSELTSAGFTNVQTEMHLGKTAGINSLTGQDIAVVGTPHLNTAAYIAAAAALNIDCSELSMSYRKIERNGYEFYFYTYNNPDLQEIQLHKIETELIQAAGRARSNRTDAKVYIFSNLPIPGVKLMC